MGNLVIDYLERLITKDKSLPIGGDFYFKTDTSIILL